VTDEEVARFALVLSEAERIRGQIAEDEAAALTAADVELPLLATASATEPLSISAAA
jgi:hypothetical protein